MFILTIFFTNKYNFWIVSGLANFDSTTNINYRYFQPARTAPRFVNQGGQTIKVKVGDTVTIPCKIQNKGKYQKYTLGQNPGPPFFLFICLFKRTTEIVDRIVNKGGQLIKVNYSGLHRAYLSSISIRCKWGYAYSFCQIF